MGFSSQGGHVAFRTQSVAGTFPADFTTNAIAMKLKTGALGVNRDIITPDPEIGGGRDVTDSYLGPVVYSGDYEFYARFNAMLTVLKAVLGTALVKSPGGTNRVQTITGGGTITGGTYTITYSAQTTAAINFDANPGTIQAALEALSSIGAGNVEVTGPDFGGFTGTGVVMTLTLRGAQTGLASAFTVTPTLTGTTPTLTVATTTAGTDYTGAATHLFLPSDAAQLPFLGIEERIGAGLEVFHYTDAVINTLHLESDASGYLSGKMGVIAKTQLAGASPIVPAGYFDNLPMVVGTNIQVTLGGVSLPAKSFSFDLNNQFEDNDFRLGSFTVGDLTPKRRMVELGFKIREQDSSLWRQAVNGASASVTPGGVTTKSPLVLTMSTYETIPGATPTLSYQLKFVLPYVLLAPYTLTASGDDVIESDIVAKAIRPKAHQQLMQAYVITPRSTVA